MITEKDLYDPCSCCGGYGREDCWEMGFDPETEKEYEFQSERECHVCDGAGVIKKPLLDVIRDVKAKKNKEA